MISLETHFSFNQKIIAKSAKKDNIKSSIGLDTQKKDLSNAKSHFTM